MSQDFDPEELLSPTDAAQLLGVSADAVRIAADTGKLPVMRTRNGRRFFKRGAVEAYRLERASKKIRAAA